MSCPNNLVLTIGRPYFKKPGRNSKIHDVLVDKKINQLLLDWITGEVTFVLGYKITGPGFVRYMPQIINNKDPVNKYNEKIPVSKLSVYEMEKLVSIMDKFIGKIVYPRLIVLVEYIEVILDIGDLFDEYNAIASLGALQYEDQQYFIPHYTTEIVISYNEERVMHNVFIDYYPDAYQEAIYVTKLLNYGIKFIKKEAPRENIRRSFCY